METRATRKQRIAVESLQIKVEELTEAIQGLQNAQQAEAQRLANLIRDESEQYARRFQTMETRLTNVENHFIHPENKIEYRNTREGPSKNPRHVAKNNDTKAVNILDVSAVPAKDTSTKKKERRVYTPMQMTYAEAFKRLNINKQLEPIGPTEDTPIAERPSWWNASEYCLYHRGRGHDTEKCFRLKHKIQDLIESGELPVPSGAN